MVNVVLVDDYRVVREGLRAIFARDPDFRVAGEADTGAEAVPLCLRLQPDLVFMDLGLPGANGIELTAQIVDVCPRTKIVIFSIHDDEDSIAAAIRAGARGFVLKKSPVLEILTAARTVASGGTYLSPQASDRLLLRLQRPEPHRGHIPEIELLSPRELQVLRLVADGRSSKEVAVMLNLEHNTIRSYRKAMMRKLRVSNLAGLIRVAHATGLVSQVHRHASVR